MRSLVPLVLLLLAAPAAPAQTPALPPETPTAQTQTPAPTAASPQTPTASPQTPTAQTQTPAPTAACDFHGARRDAAVREIQGPGPAPYHFACGVRTEGVCITGSLAAGLVVSVDRTQGDWSCVTGGDSTSGWVENSRLRPLSPEPHVPVNEWLGWWRLGEPVKGIKSDLLLLSRGSAPGSIHVSGRAYWYGPMVAGAPVEHFGSVVGDAVPIGNHLHLVESSTAGTGCVVDLTLTGHGPAARLVAYDNMQCGGANVRFSGDWQRSTPAARHSAARQTSAAR